MEQKDIKFRAWDVHINQFHYWDSVEQKNENIFWAMAKNELMPITQFSGFKDKNDEEIYEGDIINVEKIDGGIYMGQVRFFNGSFCIYTSKIDSNVISINGYNVLMHIDFDWKEYQPFYEVIGNIYENPELLNIKLEQS